MSQENEKDWSLALKVANIAPIAGSVSIRSSTALAIQRRIEQLEADRAQRGEPVAWMVVGAGENMHAETCKESAELWVKNQTNAGSPYSFSVHPLYTAPQPSQERNPMTDEKKEELAGAWFAEDWAKKSAIGMLDDYEKFNGIKP